MSTSSNNGQGRPGLLGGLTQKAAEMQANLQPPSPEKLHLARAKELVTRAVREKKDPLFAQCYAEYDAALKLNPASVEALVGWGDALYALAVRKREEVPYRECFAKYEAALKLRPKQAELHLRLAAALANYAARKRDEEMFRRSFASFEEALRLQPDLDSAQVGYANAMAQLAHVRRDEKLYGQACTKFGEAYKLRPKDAVLLNNWSAAMLEWWRLRREDSLLDAAEKLLQAEEGMTGKPSYNMACLAAIRGDFETCRAKLEACQATGSLPEKPRLLADPDLATVRDTAWFQKLVA